MQLGTDLPELDKDPEPRNTQFELLALALFVAGGAAVTIGEPDIRLVYGTENVGVAVKRLSSKRQLAQRLIDGVSQIDRAGGRGFITINLDVYFDGAAPTGELQDRGAFAARRFASLRGQLKKYAGHPSLIGIIGIGNTYNWDLSGPLPRLAASMFLQARGISDDDAQDALFEAFFESLHVQVQSRVRTMV
jgi:hypothetical protein